jgi:nitroreductase
MDKALALDEIIRSRRSVRIFEKNQEVDNDVVLKSIERATLSANSSNLQLWEFHRIKSEGLLKEFIPFCLNQNAAKTASELLVVVVRKDLWKNEEIG